MLCWLNDKAAQARARYSIKHTTSDHTAMISGVIYKFDIETPGRDKNDKNLNMNDIAKVRIKTTKPLLFDSYRSNRSTGSLILVDTSTNETVAAGMIV